LAPDVAIKAHTGADRYFRRNFFLLLTEYAMRHVAIAFIDPNIILPVFLSRLTDSPLLIGLNSSLPFTMWLFPQLFAARYLSGKTHRKQYILILMLANRPVCFVLALALLFGGVRYPPLMLTLVTLGSSLLWATQGLSSVAWFDLVDMAMPNRRRGRLFGSGQVVSGLLIVGAGLAISYILGNAGLPFPRDYVVLFLIGGAILAVDWFVMAAVKEPEETAAVDPGVSNHSFLRHLADIWKQDRDFRTFIAVRLLTGLKGLAVPFYAIYGTEQLRLGEGVVGSFTSILVIGNMVGAVLLGALYEKRGGRWSIRGGVVAGMFVPLWTLLLPSLIPAGHPWTVYAYGLVFFALGVQKASFLQGFCNYLLDLAPADQRPTYMALSNTINGVVLWPAALVGGAILNLTGNSYATLFGVTAACLGVGLLCTVWLAER
jgi:MFS-type transporter involved in bile tolerance (Atg22 family)